MKNCLLFFLFLIISFPSFSQVEFPKEIDPDKLIQDLLNDQNLSDNYEEVYDILYQYYLTPLDLNKADRNDLEGLYILSLIEINMFLNYRSKYGALLSVYELQAIPDWEITTIRKLLPFIEVVEHFDKRKFIKRVLHNPNHFILFRTDKILQKRKGYRSDEDEKNTYNGSPYKYLIRYKNSIGKDFSVGVTLEKDAGESILWSPSSQKYLMDYISCHAFIFNKGKWKAIGLGDYKVQFGQGLVFGGGFNMGKGAETILTVKKNSKGIQPYSSVMESNFFRGISFTYLLTKNIELTGLYSSNNRDASLTYDFLEQQNIVSSFNNNGMHRTNDELKNKQTTHEQAGGGNVSFCSSNKKIRTGLSYVYTQFSNSVSETDRIYNQYNFQGKDNSVVGADYSIVYENLNFFGEAAVSKNGAKALVIGGISSLSSKIDFAYLYRNYDKNFHSLYGNAFSESTINSNEKGSYWGLRIKPYSKWTISAYYDHFVFPWLNYGKDSPSNGFGYLGRLQYAPSKKILLYFQLRYEEAGKNQSDNITPIDFVVPSKKYNYMLHLDYKLGILSLRSRVQWSSYRQSNALTKGFTIVQDLLLNFRKIKISSRYAIFDTQDYDNRQYVYEKDVLYAVSFPAYNGRGIRTYLIAQFKLFRRVDLWLRYSLTRYANQDVISSGLEEIKGNKISELKIQVRYSF